MAAYAALVSVMNIIDTLQLHPRPPISLNIKQVDSLTQKLTFLQQFLESYNPQLPYSTEADPLESRIADAAYAAEDEIESHIADQINNGGKKKSSDAFDEALDKVIEEMALIQKEAVEIKETLGVQHQLLTKSTPSDSMRSASIAQKKSSMVGADDILLQMKDMLTSDRRDLQIIPIVGMGGSGLRLPPSIGLSWNLQTLIIRYPYAIDHLDIWCMSRIRHVEVTWLFLSDPPNGQDDIVLGNLQTLGRIHNFKCSQQVVKKIPNVKKLKMIDFCRSGDDSYYLNNLACLYKLESLACDIYGATNPNTLCSQINFPHSLKKLTLVSGSDILDKIGALPLLEKFKLKKGCFKDGQWETSEGQFRSLKFLSLCECNDLQVWTTESSHFPRLEHLLLLKVGNLKEIPLEFAEVSTLRVIDVSYCSDSVVESAQKILEEQEELYEEEGALQVRVKLSGDNRAPLKRLASPNFHVTKWVY